MKAFTCRALALFLAVFTLNVSAKAQCPAPLPGTANCFQTSRPNNGNPIVNKVPLPHQDCCNAIGITIPYHLVKNGSLIPSNAPISTTYPG